MICSDDEHIIIICSTGGGCVRVCAIFHPLERVGKEIKGKQSSSSHILLVHYFPPAVAAAAVRLFHRSLPVRRHCRVKADRRASLLFIENVNFIFIRSHKSPISSRKRASRSWLNANHRVVSLPAQTRLMLPTVIRAR